MGKPRRRSADRPSSHVPLDVITVPDDTVLYVRFLGPWDGILTHYGKRRPIACPGPDECDKPTHRGKGIWRGYAPVEYYRDRPYEDWCAAVLQISERLVECLGTDELRGQVWELSRVIGRYGKKECTGTRMEDVDPEGLRLDVSIYEVVERMYRPVEPLWGVKPYFKPVSTLAPTKGAPPRALVERKEREGTARPAGAADMDRLRAARGGMLGTKTGENGKQETNGVH